jgi:predicted molibdopterin-dependent oxidoreductase YjgC
VPAELIEAAALAYGRPASAAILYSTGVEARDEDSIRGIINLALLTGNLGKEGAGVFPLTEHNNLQGVCDMGMLPDRLPGYQAVSDPKARAVLESLWGSKGSRHARPGSRGRCLPAAGAPRSRRSGWGVMTP